MVRICVTKGEAKAAGLWRILEEGREVSELIRLRCPHCKKETDTPRDDTLDPPEAAVAESLCPDCIHKLNAREPECYYFDVKGDPVLDLFDPARALSSL